MAVMVGQGPGDEGLKQLGAGSVGRTRSVGELSTQACWGADAGPGGQGAGSPSGLCLPPASLWPQAHPGPEGEGLLPGPLSFVPVPGPDLALSLGVQRGGRHGLSSLGRPHAWQPGTCRSPGLEIAWRPSERNPEAPTEPGVLPVPWGSHFHFLLVTTLIGCARGSSICISMTTSPASGFFCVYMMGPAAKFQ